MSTKKTPPKKAKKRAAKKAPAKKAKKRAAKKAPPEKAKRPRARAEAPKRRLTAADRKSAFLTAYAKLARITEAAKAAGVDRAQHYRWMTEDPDYPARFQDACRDAAQTIEDSAVERALVGQYEPFSYQGKLVYPEREVVIPATKDEPERREMRRVAGAPPYGVWKRSEALHLALLRGFMPDKYRAKGAIEISGPAGTGGAIPLTDANLARLTDDELAALKRIAEKLAAGASDSGSREDQSDRGEPEPE